MASYNLGRAGFINKGNYNGAYTYEKYDVVQYNNGTYAYDKDTPSFGNLPTNTNYWIAMLDPSAMNSVAGGLVNHEVWEDYNPSKQYLKGNKVSYGGSSYVAKVPTLGFVPTNGTYWLKIAGLGYTGSTGLTGFTGSKGDTGLTGFTGSLGGLGYTGSRGNTGLTGSQGIQGMIGNTGETGYTGSFG